MNYTEVLNQIKLASQPKQAGFWGDLGTSLRKLWDPISSAFSKTNMPKPGAVNDVWTAGAKARADAVDATRKAKHIRYAKGKAAKQLQHTKDLLAGQRSVNKTLQNQLAESGDAYKSLQDRFDESQAFNKFLRGRRAQFRDQLERATAEIEAQKKLFRKQQGQLQAANELSEARLQGMNEYQQQAIDQTLRGNRWRSRAWKAGAAAVPLTGGAYLLGRINKSEGTPQQVQDYLRDAYGNPVLGADGQPILAPNRNQIAAPGTYEAWLNSRRKRK